MVVSQRMSSAGTRPKRRSACRATFLDGNALDSAGFVVDDEPGYLMVCIPAGPAPARSWWLGSIPTPTEQERQILFITSVLMVVLFIVALLIR